LGVPVDEVPLGVAGLIGSGVDAGGLSDMVLVADVVEMGSVCMPGFCTAGLPVGAAGVVTGTDDGL
jgi:hypothetical protein